MSAPRELPILMHARSVQGLLEGRKTQTRRIIKPQPEGAWAAPGRQSGPYGRIGDLLYVRETWRVHRNYDALSPRLVEVAMGGDTAYCIKYEAGEHDSGPFRDSNDHWGKIRQSIFMPKSFSRFWLRVLDVRLEQIRSISGMDCVAEGCAAGVPDYELAHYGGYKKAKQEFEGLWDDTNGPDAWERNDWVWAITYEQTEAPR